MTAGLQPLQARFRFRLDIVDADAEIENRYGEDVPVLLHGSRELCRHRLDTALVTDYLAGIG